MSNAGRQSLCALFEEFCKETHCWSWVNPWWSFGWNIWIICWYYNIFEGKIAYGFILFNICVSCHAYILFDNICFCFCRTISLLKKAWGSVKPSLFFFLTVITIICMMRCSDQHISLVDDLVIIGCIDLPSCPKSRKLMVPLQCSLNMLEGDTGYASIWFLFCISFQIIIL